MIPKMHNFYKIKRSNLLYIKHGGDKHKIKQILDRGDAHDKALEILNGTIDDRSKQELNIYGFSAEHLPYTHDTIKSECDLEDIVMLRILAKYIAGIQSQAKTRVKRFNAIGNPLCQSIVKRNSNYLCKLNNLIESYYNQVVLPVTFSDKQYKLTSLKD